MAEIKTVNCDVLVIGGGETGIRAAVEAKRQGVEHVLLVTKGTFGEAGVMFSEITFGWDMQASTGQNDPTDNMDRHLSDIMCAAQGTCSEKLAQILTKEAPDRVHDLEDIFNLEIYKKPDGTPRQVYGCFSTKDRCYQFIHPDEIKGKVANSLKENSVNLIEKMMVTDLIIEDNACKGAIGIFNDGSMLIINSKATILAAGGATGMFKHNFASPGMCGDGYSLALRAGCKLANMEFMQFGLGLLEPKYRALFLDRLMYLQPKVEFTYDHHFPCDISEMLSVHSRHFPFSTIDASYLFDVAVLEETIQNGGKGVAVDLSVIPKRKLEEIPVWSLYYNYFDADNDPYNNKLRITCFAHACNGGVIIDENANTGLNGLFAAGEMVTGPHGANRLGGNMHAACQVFGTRAGKSAAAYVSTHTITYCKASALPQKRSKYIEKDYTVAKEGIGNTLWENVNVCRSEDGLATALKVVEQAAALLNGGVPEDQYLWSYYELRSTVLAAKAIIISALERKETRGGHFRKDYPKTDKKAYVIKVSLVGEDIATEKCDGYPI